MTPWPRSLALTAALALTACEASAPRPLEEPASVTLGAIRRGAAGPVTIRRGAAEAVIEELSWVIADVELHACTAPAPTSTLWDHIGVREARAHVPDSATRIGAPYVEDLLAEPGRARIWGEIAPPPLAYCALWAILAPADEDVVNQTALPTERIVGRSFLLAGRFRPSKDAAWEPFSHALAVRRALPVRFADPKSGAPSLALDGASASAFVLLEKEVGPSVFASIEPRSLKTEAGARAALDAVARSLAVYENPRRPKPSETKKEPR